MNFSVILKTLVILNQVVLMAESNPHLVPGKDVMQSISWNVKGLNQVIRRKWVLSHLQCLEAGTSNRKPTFKIMTSLKFTKNG